MSRIIYPSGFDQQYTLAQNILNKNNSDGAASVLNSFLIQQGIDPAADVASGSAARDHESSRLLLVKQSQNLSELRDLKSGLVFTHMKGCHQFLKSFYKPNFKALGDWGVSIGTNGKINYPADITARIGLFKMLKTKHDSFPAGESPLESYLIQNNINLTVDDASIDSTLDYHTTFQQMAKAAENETEQRDLLWQPVNGHIHAVGDFLKKLYNDNPKALGLWGFTVDSSPRSPKERISTIKPGDKVTINGAVLGSTLVNIGKTDIHIYIGKTTSANPVIVQASGSFGILKGSSLITVSNPSTIETARLKVLVTG